MKMLNLACGNRYHNDWINIDINSPSKYVKRVNILKGIPYYDNYFDVVYSSHFIEHLSFEQVRKVLYEIKRVLKPEGILRIVVPDLENICNEYLNILKIVKEDNNYNQKYEWIVSELLDQMVRIKSGGKMLEIFNKVKKDINKNKDLASYIKKRTGDDLFVENKLFKKITFYKIKNKVFYIYLNLVKMLIPKNIRDSIFVQTNIGEKHLWMYDEYSLKILLEEYNFKNISRKSFNESDIPNFNSYFLDINKDNTPYKGISSLYIEAKK